MTKRIFESKKTGAKAVLINSGVDNVVLEMVDDGERKTLAESTFKRWWKEISVEEIMEDQQEDKKIENLNKKEVIDTNTEDWLLQGGAVGKDLKNLKEKKEGLPEEVARLKTFIDAFIDLQGCQGVESRPGIVGIVYEKLGCLAYHYTSKSITIWVKSKAVGDMVGYKKINHMLDYRIKFTEYNDENVDFIKDLLILSIDFAKEKIKARK